MNRRLIAITVFLLSCTFHASANGKFYAAREHVPPDVPYQRALLIYNEGKETLVLQSRLRLSGPLPVEAAYGWVVPVPTEPELSSMTAEQASDLFRQLNQRSGPSIIDIPISLILFLLAIILVIIVFRRKKNRVVYITFGVCLLLSIFIAFFIRMPLTSPPPGVEIIREQEVGIYLAKVIKASNSSGLIAWLNEGGFQFQASDQPVLDSYLKRGWMFVVATIRPEEKTKALRSYEGMPDPLIIHFASKSPVYPLALTGTVGTPTEIVLYVLAQKKMHCRPSLELKFAGNINRIPSEFPFETWENSLKFLCKFKGTFTPAEMRQDLVLEPAPDNARFRERYISWW